MIVYYLNLDHRTDRKFSIEQQLKGLPWPIVRVPGFFTQGRGIIGCGMSHIRALELFLESEHETCIIFEDDFAFTRPKSEFVLPDFDWDVCMLGGCVTKTEPLNENFERAIHVGTASGYAVTKKFAPILIQNFKEGLEHLIRDFCPPKYAIDVYMTKLQPVSNWLICKPVFGVQMPSYSDIENRYVNFYEDAFK